MSTPVAPRRRLLRLAAGIVVILVMAAAAWAWTRRPEVVGTYERPDHRYKVVVLRQAPLLPTLPGQSGDAPGVVRLVDHDGRVLQEAPVEQVQVVDGVTWVDHGVQVKLVADWSLPD